MPLHAGMGAHVCECECLFFSSMCVYVYVCADACMCVLLCVCADVCMCVCVFCCVYEQMIV